MASSNNAPASEPDFFGKIGEAFQLINASWDALKLNISTFILVVLVPALVVMAASLFFLLPAFFSENGSNTATALSSFVAFIVMVAALVVALIFLPAITITQLASARGKKVAFGEVFEESKQFVLRYIGLVLLGALVAGAPLILSFLLIFVIIGIFLIPLAVAWAMVVAFFLVVAPFILIDKNLGVVDSIKASYELTKKHWQWVLAIFVVNFVIGLPQIVPVIGWVISLVLSIAYFCLPAIIYVTKFSKTKSLAKEAKTK